MSSKGSPIVRVRLVPPLLDRINEAIASNNAHVHGEPWNLSSWMVDALWSKLAHQSRAKKQREARKSRRRRRPALPGAGDLA